jgi:CheY-like chemotaxis protein
MFFASKIRAVAEAVGAEISFARSKEALIQKAREAKPRLVIVDLHNQKIDPQELVQELPGIRLLGFFSHVQTDLQRNALAAGFDRVIPRSVFARDLAEILAADDAD